MRIMSRGRSCVRAAAAAVLALGVLAAPAGADFPAPDDAEPQAAALQEFQKRLADYVTMRTDLAKRLEPLSPTASAAELSTRQESLAAAIRSTRKDARPGDLIPAGVAAQLRTTVANDFKARTPEARKAAVREIAGGVALKINRAFPANAALPTVPPLLLAKLPTLPDNLQYRFVDRHLVIVDGDTQIIIDYVPDVLPVP